MPELSVQEVVALYSKLLYKLGNYYLDILYSPRGGYPAFKDVHHSLNRMIKMPRPFYTASLSKNEHDLLDTRYILSLL